MLKDLYDHFLKKIVFTDDLLSSIEDFNNIKWLSNTGNTDYIINSRYNVYRCTEKEALTYLNLDMDTKNTVCLANLLLLGQNIMSGYLSKHYGKSFGIEWNKVTNKTDKYIDFKKLTDVETSFNKKHSSDVGLYLKPFAAIYFISLYYYERYPNIPRELILEFLNIYLQGHIVVGWKGKTALSQHGSLLVF